MIESQILTPAICGIIIGFVLALIRKNDKPAMPTIAQPPKDTTTRKPIEVVSVNGNEVAVVHVNVSGMTTDQRRDYLQMLKDGTSKIDGFNVWLIPHFKD